MSSWYAFNILFLLIESKHAASVHDIQERFIYMVLITHHFLKVNYPIKVKLLSEFVTPTFVQILLNVLSLCMMRRYSEQFAVRIGPKRESLINLVILLWHGNLRWKNNVSYVFSLHPIKILVRTRNCHWTNWRAFPSTRNFVQGFEIPKRRW